jgi:uncharacterized protein (TIGR02996 family)
MAMVNVSQLVQQVRNNPEDVQARLVLADVWMEQGNPQGQLMLWTAQWEQMAIGDDGYSDLRRKCEGLQKELGDSFRGKWGVESVGFEHGYVSKVKVTQPGLLEKLREGGTVDDWCLVTDVALRVDTRFLEPCLSSLSSLHNLSSLDLDGNQMRAEGIKILVASPILKTLVSLKLDFNFIGDEGVQALAESPTMKNLTH